MSIRPISGISWLEIPEPATGTLAHLAWQTYRRHQFQVSEQTRRREVQTMALEDRRSRVAQDLYYRELDQQRNRGVITTDEYNRLRYPSSSTKTKLKKKKKNVTTQGSRKPGPKPPRPPPPPPPSGRFSALSIR